MMLIFAEGVGVVMVAAALVLATVVALRSRQRRRMRGRVLGRIDRYPSESGGVALTLAATGLVILAWPPDQQPPRALPPVSPVPPPSPWQPPSTAVPPALDHPASGQQGGHTVSEAAAVWVTVPSVNDRSEDRGSAESAGPQGIAASRHQASPSGMASAGTLASGPEVVPSPAALQASTSVIGGPATIPAPGTPPRSLPETGH